MLQYFFRFCYWFGTIFRRKEIRRKFYKYAPVLRFRKLDTGYRGTLSRDGVRLWNRIDKGGAEFWFNFRKSNPELPPVIMKFFDDYFSKNP